LSESIFDPNNSCHEKSNEVSVMQRIWKFLALPAITLRLCPAVAQTLTPDVAAQVDKVFEKWNRTDTPGCALGVYKDGQIIYKHGYGMANLNDDVTITPETVFHVASMSKQFTAFSILLLQISPCSLRSRPS
jgi:CubicO group peptidase (beta-lactamase class C family)